MVLSTPSSYRGHARLLGRIASAVAALVLAAAQGVVAQRSGDVVVRIPAAQDSRGWFGFSFSVERTDAPGTRAESMVAVESVVQGSPAARGGLRGGDILLLLAGRPVSRDWMDGVARGVRAGDTLHVRVRRDGGVRDLALVAARRPHAVYMVRDQGVLRPYLPDSLQLRVRMTFDSIRANLGEVRLSVGDRAPGATAELIIRDAVGEERRIRVPRAEAEVVMRNLRAALNRQRALAPTEVRIENLRQGAEELRWVLEDLERVRQESRPDTSRIWIRRGSDSAFAFRAAPPARRGLSVMVNAGLGVAGAEFVLLKPEMSPYFGVDTGLLVVRVGVGTPAHRAGLQAGDVVISAAGRRPGSVADLSAALAAASGDGLPVEVIRKQTRRRLRIPGP
ncbi:MAG: PDZ domain-containing protein [Gemmatimonadota bacterium]